MSECRAWERCSRWFMLQPAETANLVCSTSCQQKHPTCDFCTWFEPSQLPPTATSSETSPFSNLLSQTYLHYICHSSTQHRQRMCPGPRLWYLDDCRAIERRIRARQAITHASSSEEPQNSWADLRILAHCYQSCALPQAPRRATKQQVLPCLP